MAKPERDEEFERLIMNESPLLQEVARTAFYDVYESPMDFEDVDDDDFIRIQDLVAVFRERKERIASG